MVTRNRRLLPCLLGHGGSCFPVCTGRRRVGPCRPTVSESPSDSSREALGLESRRQSEGREQLGIEEIVEAGDLALGHLDHDDGERFVHIGAGHTV